MSSADEKEPALPFCRSNPGVGTEAKVAFSNGERKWTETVDLVAIAEVVLKRLDYSVTRGKAWLLHADSGFMIRPQIVGVHPLDKGGVRTVTTVQCNHPTLVPAGVFEYQHSTGDGVEESISKGFEQWAQTDFVPLLDALRTKPKTCTTLEMEFPAKGGKEARARRAVLGPVAHFVQNPPKVAAGAPAEHPFCPCCLLTNSFQAFKGLIEGEEFFCLRLFAARDTAGAPQADCRVNGEDWEQGAAALRDYAKTWPPAGYEFRKQYVVLQNTAKG